MGLSPSDSCECGSARQTAHSSPLCVSNTDAIVTWSGWAARRSSGFGTCFATMRMALESTAKRKKKSNLTENCSYDEPIQTSMFDSKYLQCCKARIAAGNCQAPKVPLIRIHPIHPIHPIHSYISDHYPVFNLYSLKNREGQTKLSSN